MPESFLPLVVLSIVALAVLPFLMRLVSKLLGLVLAVGVVGMWLGAFSQSDVERKVDERMPVLIHHVEVAARSFGDCVAASAAGNHICVERVSAALADYGITEACVRAVADDLGYLGQGLYVSSQTSPPRPELSREAILESVRFEQSRQACA